jgi:ADP-heptose:LPS heptosyltransferase
VSAAPDHLVIIRLSAMGDVAMLVPVILAVQTERPGIAITVVTRAGFTPIFEDIPGVKTLAVYTKGMHRGFKGLWRLSRQILALRPSAIADLHNVLRTQILKIFLLGHGISYRVLDKDRAAKRKLTRVKNKLWKPLKSSHERYANTIMQLGYPAATWNQQHVLSRKTWPEIPGVDAARDQEINIGIAPFAAHPGKCYPEKLMEEVLRGIHKNLKCNFYLFGGGAQEVARLAKWEHKFTYCTSLAGKTRFKAELAALSNLDLMIAMDSGNGHLAAMYGVPVITLWGITHPYAGFAPYLQPERNSITSDRERYSQIPTSIYGNKMPESYRFVMETILPETVVLRALEILSTSSKLKSQSGF